MHAFNIHHNYKFDTARFEEGKRPSYRRDLRPEDTLAWCVTTRMTRARNNRTCVVAQKRLRPEFPQSHGGNSLGVMASSNGFSRQGSKFLIAPRPRESANFVTYDIQESVAPTIVAASVTFYMREGWVRPNTDGSGCTLPAVPLDKCQRSLGNECRR